MSTKKVPGYYAVLGVSKNANEDEIKTAYRRKATQLHPDKTRDLRTGETFRVVNDAQEVLRDAERRKNYDRELYNYGWQLKFDEQHASRDVRLARNRGGSLRTRDPQAMEANIRRTQTTVRVPLRTRPEPAQIWHTAGLTGSDAAKCSEKPILERSNEHFVLNHKHYHKASTTHDLPPRGPMPSSSVCRKPVPEHNPEPTTEASVARARSIKARPSRAVPGYGSSSRKDHRVNPERKSEATQLQTSAGSLHRHGALRKVAPAPLRLTHTSHEEHEAQARIRLEEAGSFFPSDDKEYMKPSRRDGRLKPRVDFEPSRGGRHRNQNVRPERYVHVYTNGQVASYRPTHEYHDAASYAVDIEQHDSWGSTGPGAHRNRGTGASRAGTKAAAGALYSPSAYSRPGVLMINGWTQRPQRTTQKRSPQNHNSRSIDSWIDASIRAWSGNPSAGAGIYSYQLPGVQEIDQRYKTWEDYWKVVSSAKKTKGT